MIGYILSYLQHFQIFREHFCEVHYRYIISYNIGLIEAEQTGTDIAVPINYPLERRADHNFLARIRFESLIWIQNHIY